MQRTTILSYPHLVDIKPINGIVYKATRIYRPNPKMTVMPLQEVQMHQKHESVAEMMQQDKPRRQLLRLKEKVKSFLKETALCSDFDASESLELSFEKPDSLVRPTPPSQQSRKQESKADKISRPFRKVKNNLKKVFKPKTESALTNAPGDVEEATLRTKATPVLKPGFLCAQNGCAQCSVPAPVTPPNRAPPPVPVEPIYQSTPEFMSSGFTSTTAGSAKSSVIVSSSPTDLDIFQDFDGTHIEPTPPQIDPLHPISSFVSKLHGILLSDVEWSLADFTEMKGDTTLAVSGGGPKDTAYPTPPVSEDENWPLPKVEATPLMPTAEPKMEDSQRERSFKEKMPDEALVLLARGGGGARRRRLGAA